jgi:molecular chaperone DnaK
VPQIEVKFDIDSNGILNVSAKDKTSGKEQSITIKNSTNLDEEEIERMKKEAEEHAEEDRKQRELVEARNKARSVGFELEKQLKDYGDKLSDDDKKEIEQAVEKLQEMAEKEDVTKQELEEATEQTLTTAQKLGEAMRQAQQSKADQAGAGEKSAEGKKDSQKDSQDESDEDVEEGEVIN